MQVSNQGDDKSTITKNLGYYYLFDVIWGGEGGSTDNYPEFFIENFNQSLDTFKKFSFAPRELYLEPTEWGGEIFLLSQETDYLGNIILPLDKKFS